MKKKFKLEDLDCANCAAKMEDMINKIDGVNEASVSFLTEKLILDAEDDMFEKCLEEAIKCIEKVHSSTKVIR